MGEAKGCERNRKKSNDKSGPSSIPSVCKLSLHGRKKPIKMGERNVFGKSHAARWKIKNLGFVVFGPPHTPGAHKRNRTIPSREKLAQEAFKQGQIQYNLGRFEKALEHFSKAYETMPHGAFSYWPMSSTT